MSANFPPPQQPAPGQNPYAQQQPPAAGPYGQPPAPSPYGAPAQPGAFNPAAYPPPAGYPSPAPVVQRRNDAGLGILVGFGAALLVALAYGGLLRALSKNDGTFYEFRLGAVAVGLLVGVAVGKAGGRNPVLPVLAILFAIGAVVFGELFGGALIISHFAATHDGHLSLSDIFFHHFGDLWDAWKADFGFKRVIFLVFAGIAAFGMAKRLGDS
jgi:hypothetical protein